MSTRIKVSVTLDVPTWLRHDGEPVHVFRERIKKEARAAWADRVGAISAPVASPADGPWAGATQERVDLVGELMNAADDDGAAQIEEAALDAGLLWNCRDKKGAAHWTNPGYATKCEECGKPRPATPGD